MTSTAPLPVFGRLQVKKVLLTAFTHRRPPTSAADALQITAEVKEQNPASENMKKTDAAVPHTSGGTPNRRWCEFG